MKLRKLITESTGTKFDVSSINAYMKGLREMEKRVQAGKSALIKLRMELKKPGEVSKGQQKNTDYEIVPTTANEWGVSAGYSNLFVLIDTAKSGSYPTSTYTASWFRKQVEQSKHLKLINASYSGIVFNLDLSKK